MTLLPLSPGTKAPDFTLKDQDKNYVTLSSYRSVKNVLLAFFPMAFTGICTGELACVRDGLSKFQNATTETLTVSVSDTVLHKMWAAQNGYTFPVLSDFWPHGAIAASYGVLDDKTGRPHRGTFIIDTGGIIRFSEMNPAGEPRDQAAWEHALHALRPLSPHL